MRRAACFDVPIHHGHLWAEYAEGNQDAAPILDKGEAKAAGFADGFMPEIFHRLYAETPKAIDPAHVDPAAAVRAKLHALASDLPEFDVLRHSTVRDAASAGVAALCLASRLTDAIPPRVSPADADKARAILEGLESVSRVTAETRAAMASHVTGAKRGLHAAQMVAQGEADSLDETEIRNALRAGLGEAQRAIDDARAAWSAFGYGGADPNGGMPMAPADPGVAVELARRVRASETLRRIVELAGRLILTARAKRASRTEYARSEMVGIEPTGDISRVLTTEKMGLLTPIGTAALFSRLLEKSALGYKVAGRERSSKGPIVACLDQSGSMKNADRDPWAKAIALALLDAARAERRAFGLVLYNERVIESRLFEVAHDADPRAILAILSRAPHGNTAYAPALRQALDWIEDASRRGGTFRKADIVHVTDGEAPLDGSAMALARAERLGVHLYGIGLGYVSDALTAWSHDTAVVSDVSNDTAAVNLIFDGV